MKAALLVIQNDSDHAAAKSLVERLMRSGDAADRARMTAQARLIEPLAPAGARSVQGWEIFKAPGMEEFGRPPEMESPPQPRSQDITERPLTHEQIGYTRTTHPGNVPEEPDRTHPTQTCLQHVTQAHIVHIGLLCV